jgi:hypothetical protein
LIAQLRTDAATALGRVLELQYRDRVLSGNVHGPVGRTTVCKDDFAADRADGCERRADRGADVRFLIEGLDDYSNWHCAGTRRLACVGD